MIGLGLRFARRWTMLETTSSLPPLRGPSLPFSSVSMLASAAATKSSCMPDPLRYGLSGLCSRQAGGGDVRLLDAQIVRAEVQHLGQRQTGVPVRLRHRALHLRLLGKHLAIAVNVRHHGVEGSAIVVADSHQVVHLLGAIQTERHLDFIFLDDVEEPRRSSSRRSRSCRTKACTLRCVAPLR